ncbi:MAG TPA: trypsin-like peptidase domain-containing protein [Candidatus Polarisedimenticolaceae bacterium]|nr:trypsin-like peptidase domain-containing protein [Candidatus Polarisedimenticolaceae bacterium]
MNSRTFGFVSLMAVIGVSIVFGMILGGKLNAPQVSFAAPPGAPPVDLAPAVTGLGGLVDFADVVERAMPAVVSVRSAELPGESRAEDDPEPDAPRQRGPEEWFFRFFGDPDDPSPQRPPGQPRIGEGSGFIISTDGYLLTNNHVVETADDITVGLTNGREYKAKVIGTDPSIDLALLKIESEGESLPTLPLGDSSDLRVGEWVIAIGNPLEFEQTVTVGVLSAKERRVAIGSTDAGVVSFLQTDAAINFGNSGGPLLDSRGNVIGINTAIRRANFAEGIGFALPIDHARLVMDQLRQRGYVKRGYIGITMNPTGIDEEAREYLGLPDGFGVLVEAVTGGGPADQAGIQTGDVIRKVDGEVVKDNLDLIGKIAARQPGDSVKIELFRKQRGRGETVRVEAELSDREEGLASATGRPTRPAQPVPEPEVRESSGLGMTVTELTDGMRERLSLDEDAAGVLITDVEFNSQAADKGIGPDMVVTSIDNTSVSTVAEWESRIDQLVPGDVVKLHVLAGGRDFTVFLRVPER